MASEQSKEPLQNSKMRRYMALLEYLGSNHHIDDIFTISSGHAPNKDQNMWNTPDSYTLVLGALLSFLPISDKEYILMLREAQSDEAETSLKNDRNDHLKKYEIEKRRCQKLAQIIKSSRVFEGVSIAEIGGTTLDVLLTPLGTLVDYRDAGLSWGLPDRNSLVTLENYEQFFPKQYDFTVTNYVFGCFAPQSGVADIHSGLSRSSMEGVFAEMFAMLWNLTKQSGYSIHCYVDTAPISPETLERIGFEVVHASYEKSITQPFETRTYTGEIMKGFKIGGFQKDTDVYDIRDVYNYYKGIGYIPDFDFDSFWKNDRGINLLVLRKQKPNLPDNWRMFLGRDSDTRKVRTLTFDHEQHRFYIEHTPFREYREHPF